MSGRQGRFSGLVTDGMSSMGAMTGLVGPRWTWALAILALVGLVGLAALTLCSDVTGKGPACPGFECYEQTRGKEQEKVFISLINLVCLDVKRTKWICIFMFSVSLSYFNEKKKKTLLPHNCIDGQRQNTWVRVKGKEGIVLLWFSLTGCCVTMWPKKRYLKNVTWCMLSCDQQAFLYWPVSGVASWDTAGRWVWAALKACGSVLTPSVGDEVDTCGRCH